MRQNSPAFQRSEAEFLQEYLSTITPAEMQNNGIHFLCPWKRKVPVLNAVNTRIHLHLSKNESMKTCPMPDDSNSRRAMLAR